MSHQVVAEKAIRCGGEACKFTADQLERALSRPRQALRSEDSAELENLSAWGNLQIEQEGAFQQGLQRIGRAAFALARLCAHTRSAILAREGQQCPRKCTTIHVFGAPTAR